MGMWKEKPEEPSKKREEDRAEREKKIKEAKEYVAKMKPKIKISSGNKTYEVDFKVIIGKAKKD